MHERIVITGMGTVNPLGLSVPESWRNAIIGVSGVGPITLFDASHLGAQIACEVKNFNPEDFMSAREARRRDARGCSATRSRALADRFPCSSA